MARLTTPEAPTLQFAGITFTDYWLENSSGRVTGESQILVPLSVVNGSSLTKESRKDTSATDKIAKKSKLPAVLSKPLQTVAALATALGMSHATVQDAGAISPESSILWPGIIPCQSEDAGGAERLWFSIRLGEITPPNFPKQPSFQKSQALADGSNLYEFASMDSSENNLVLVKDGTIVLQRFLPLASNLDRSGRVSPIVRYPATQCNPNASRYGIRPKLSTYLRGPYGQPEAQIKDTVRNPSAETDYVFASKGVSIVGRPGSDEVWQIRTFAEGMRVQDYIARFGPVLTGRASPASAAPAPVSGPSCRFELGFKALRDQIPEEVGDCLENEHFNLDNGNAEQRTTAHHGKGGLLVWRKADNWTAYTDGGSTWINGPYGMQKRANTELFDWEKP